MIQKYKEIIKTKEELERKSLVNSEAFPGFKIGLSDGDDNDQFDFSPSIPKKPKTKHYSLIKTTLKKNNKANVENLLKVSDNPFAAYANFDNNQPTMTESLDVSSMITFNQKKNDSCIIESIEIPSNNKKALSHFKTMEESRISALDDERESINFGNNFDFHVEKKIKPGLLFYFIWNFFYLFLGDFFAYEKKFPWKNYYYSNMMKKTEILERNTKKTYNLGNKKEILSEKIENLKNIIDLFQSAPVNN